MAHDPKDTIASAISRAQVDLMQALSELEKITSFGPGAITYATHALNNYLAVTSAAVQLISRRLANHPDPQITEWIDGVAHATDMMAKLVTQLMNASVTSDATLRFEQVNVALSVQRFCDFYRPVASRKSIRLNFHSDADLKPVWTDRVAMLSVLDNVISNAIKYSLPESDVWLSVTGDDATVTCAVRDEGPGLHAQDQARLFQQGAKLTPRPTAGEASSGYGLAIAKDLMDQLDGSIWCESAVGKGTCFFVRLPVYKESMETHANG